MPTGSTRYEPLPLTTFSSSSLPASAYGSWFYESTDLYKWLNFYATVSSPHLLKFSSLFLKFSYEYLIYYNRITTPKFASLKYLFAKLPIIKL
jgi:hypothetical protein